MVELPEPDFYTLAEVAERWGVSEDVLLRLGVERKIIIGEGIVPPVDLVSLSVALGDSESMASFLFNDWETIVDWDMQQIDISEPVPKKMYMRVLNAADLLYTMKYTKGIKNKPKMIGIDPRMTNDDLVIPTVEIHRIERQHEAAKQAADNDVLGTKEKETMQAVIAAMTQIIANAKNKYKHGDRPNVNAIATDLEGMIPDRKKRGISDTIGKALKAGLIRT